MKTAITTSETALHEGREDADAVVAEGHPLVRRLVGDPERVPAEPERGRVGQVVPRVREQREAVREPSADRLDEDERKRQRDRRSHRPARDAVRYARGGAIMVRVIVEGVHHIYEAT